MTEKQGQPPVVTDRMQGVDCPECEDSTPHTHKATAVSHDGNCRRSWKAGKACFHEKQERAVEWLKKVFA